MNEIFLKIKRRLNNNEKIKSEDRNILGCFILKVRRDKSLNTSERETHSNECDYQLTKNRMKLTIDKNKSK